MVPSARFATTNYLRGGWHPLGYIGIGKAPVDATLKDITFDSPAFDDSLHYIVPEKLRSVKAPPLPPVKAVTPWTPDPRTELINPWRYWTLETNDHGLEKQILNERGRVMRVTGDFGRSSSLNCSFGNGIKLDRGHYHFAFRARGTPGLPIEFELADGWRKVSKEADISLSTEWKEHRIEFEIKTKFNDETTLRFRLPHDAKGTFDLSYTRFRKSD